MIPYENYKNSALFQPLLAKIISLLNDNLVSVIAIEGKCGAGKSTLAAFLENCFPCSVIHMDDFYLPPALRSEERLNSPGGNIHYERFLKEVAAPLQKRKESAAGNALCPNRTSNFSYRVFDCHKMTYAGTVTVLPKPLIIVEGSYSLRPEFRSLYDFSVFLDLSDSLQKERILTRAGEEQWHNFKTRWIPMENKYFSYYKIKECCDLSIRID